MAIALFFIWFTILRSKKRVGILTSILVSCLLATTAHSSAGNATLWLKSKHPHIVFGDDQDTWLYRMKSGAIASNDAIVARRIVLLADSAAEDEGGGGGGGDAPEGHAIINRDHNKKHNVTLQLLPDGSLSLDGVGWPQQQTCSSMNAINVTVKTHTQDLASLRNDVQSLNRVTTQLQARDAKAIANLTDTVKPLNTYTQLFYCKLT